MEKNKGPFMSSGIIRAIKGGMDYIQAFLDSNPLTQGLSKLRTKLKSWQLSLSKMGALARNTAIFLRDHNLGESKARPHFGSGSFPCDLTRNRLSFSVEQRPSTYG